MQIRNIRILEIYEEYNVQMLFCDDYRHQKSIKNPSKIDLKTKPGQMCKMMPKGIKIKGKRDADIKQKYIKVTAGKPRVAKSSPKVPQTACP